MRLIFFSCASSVAVLSLLSVMLTPMQASATVQFTRTFAPQDGRVSPAEKPYRAELCLNGAWHFQPVALPSDFRQGKSLAPVLPPPTSDGWEKTPIRIPSPWNANSFADEKGESGDFRCFPSYPTSWNGVQMGWLHRTFSVPAAWKGRRLILHFDAVAGDTQVVVNGRTVGSHFDIFLPFDVDVTDAVKSGAKNDLLVGVRKASLFDVPGRYGRRTYQGGSMWGQHIVGIWQDVTLEALPVVHVVDVFVKPLVSQDRLEADVTVKNDTGQPVHISLDGNAFSWISDAGTDMLSAPEPRWRLGKAAALGLSSVTAFVPAYGSATVTLAGKVSGRLRLWSPDSPNLYGLVCRIKSRSGVTDAKYTRFGWRQITFQNAQVMLNGKRLLMKGNSWHFIGIPEMTRRYAWAWYKALKDAHLNAVRLHAEPYPAFFMDVADEQGILVLDESAMWASDGGPKLDDPAYWKDTERHLQGLVLRDRNHASVFGWSVSNEIMPVIRNVFHAPKEMEDELIRYDGLWASLCHKYDPTRVWISADGEDDAKGLLPTYVVHYGDASTFQRAAAAGKPWGVGEAGPAYYGTPEQIAQMASDPRAYLSAEDRMEGVATVSYQNLIAQKKFNASYCSVFNLVWYGLKPLNFGMADTTRPPTLKDGVFFGKFVEGKPGVQPERLGPYAGTLNPGYDPSLPLYQTWPLFDAIKDAQSDPPIAYQPSRPFMVNASTARNPATGDILSVLVLSSAGGSLAQALTAEGVTVLTAGSAFTAPAHSLVMIDGVQPPGDDAKPAIDAAIAAGETVIVWGVSPDTLGRLNRLLPERLELTDRTASSLVVLQNNRLTAGLTPASLYFSELTPSTILHSGLSGPLITGGTVLLAACDTDWKRWNGQPETAKTVMLLRSERETKLSGAALVELTRGTGRLIVCALPITPETPKAEALNRTLLGNFGIKLGNTGAQGSALNSDGIVTHALAWGWAGAASVTEALADTSVDPNSGAAIIADARIGRRAWRPVNAAPGNSLDLSSLVARSGDTAELAYLSFWLYSPKALDNLLLDPHLPNVGLHVGPAAAAQTWLNGKPIQTIGEGGQFCRPDAAAAKRLESPSGQSGSGHRRQRHEPRREADQQPDRLPDPYPWDGRKAIAANPASRRFPGAHRDSMQTESFIVRSAVIFAARWGGAFEMRAFRVTFISAWSARRRV